MRELRHVLLRDLLTDSQNGLSKRNGDEGVLTPVLRLSDIFNGEINETNPREISLTSSEIQKYGLTAGDLVCIRVNGSKGLVGRVVPFRSKRKWAYCDHFIRLRPRHDIVDSRYVAHYLQTKVVRRHIELNMVSSAGQNTVSQGTMLNVVVPLPSLVEQRRTVEEIEKQFSRIDEAVATLQRVKASLQRYHAAVVDGAVANWPLIPLGDLLREPLRNGHSAKASSDGNGLRVFTLSAVTYGDFSERNTKKTVADPRKVAELWAQPGDIYIERSNTPDLVGTARLYRGPVDFAFIPDLLIRVRLIETTFPEYVELALQTGAARRYFKARAQGISGTMPKIDQSAVAAFPVPLPPRVEQRRIVAEIDRRLSIVREVGAEVDANLKRARSLRQAILSKAFSLD